jgi:tetratricopeptide (TPR) repeat protein
LDDDPSSLAWLGQAYARNGQKDEAQKILARLTEEAKSRYVSAYSFALMFIALGDKDRAMDAMERAYREGAGNDIFLIKVDPMLDDLRGQPRFEAFLTHGTLDFIAASGSRMNPRQSRLEFYKMPVL